MKKKLQLPLNCRLVELLSIFNSSNSGLLVVTDKCTVYDICTKSMKPVCCVNFAGAYLPLDTVESKEDLDLSKSRLDVSIAKNGTAGRLNTLSSMISNITSSCFIDSDGKSIFTFLEDGNIVVTIG